MLDATRAKVHNTTRSISGSPLATPYVKSAATGAGAMPSSAQADREPPAATEAAADNERIRKSRRSAERAI